MPIVHDDAQSTLDNVVGIQGVQTGGSGANMSATGGTGHVVKQASMGAAFTTGTIAATDIADNAITNAKLRDSAALSLIGRSVNSSGDPGDISSSANEQFPYRRSNVISFVAHPTILITPTGADQTAEVQAAVDTVGLGACIEFSSGNLLLTDTIRISQHGVTIRGQNKRGTQVYFQPTSGGKPCFHFQNTLADPIYQCGISGLQFRSNDTTLQKIAIRCTDTSEFNLTDIVIGAGSSWRGNGDSIGLQTQGRDHGYINHLSASSNIPISIEQNPNHANLDLDHWDFEHCYLTAYDDTQPVIKVADGVHLGGNPSFRQHAWIGGSHGFYYNDTTTSGYFEMCKFDGIRWEQADTGGLGYMVWFVVNHGYRNLTLERMQCGGGTQHNGFYLRNVEQVTLRHCDYFGSIEALNVDGTVEETHIQNCQWVSGSTMSMTNQVRVFAAARRSASGSPGHATEIWVSSLNGNLADGVYMSDAQFNVVDSADNTKKLQLNAGGITAGQRRVLTAPDYDGTIATLAGSETLSGKVYQGSTLQTSGNIGVGTTPGAANGEMLFAQNDLDGITLIRSKNANASGTAAQAVVKVENDNGSGLSVVSHGTARTVSRWGQTLGGWLEILAAAVTAGDGLAIGTSTARPLVMGTAGVAGLQFDGTNPHPSFPVSHKRVTVQYDNTTTTLGAVTGLTVNVTAGKTYGFRAILHTTSDVGGGVKCAIAGTCTATAIIYDAVVYYGGQTVGTTNQRGTALGSTVGQVTAVVTAKILVDGVITVANAGTLLPQLACNVAAGTTSALVGSEWFVWEIQ